MRHHHDDDHDDDHDDELERLLIATEALAVALEVIASQQRTIAALTNSSAPAIGAVLTIGGNPPMTITVGSTTAEAVLSFIDTKTGAPAPIPPGAVVTFTSSDPTVATVGSVAPGATPDVLIAAITALSPSSAVTFGATVVDSNGLPLFTVTSVTTDVVAAPPPPVADGAVLTITP